MRQLAWTENDSSHPGILDRCRVSVGCIGRKILGWETHQHAAEHLQMGTVDCQGGLGGGQSGAQHRSLPAPRLMLRECMGGIVPVHRMCPAMHAQEKCRAQTTHTRSGLLARGFRFSQTCIPIHDIAYYSLRSIQPSSTNHPAMERPRHFVQLSEDRTQLALDGKPWRMVGANCYYLMVSSHTHCGSE